MIPYLEVTTLSIGPIPIHVWGLFVALGVLAGTYAASWMAKKRGLNSAIIWDLSFWVMLAAIIGGRLFHVIVYEPAFYLANLGEVFAIWQGGMSVTGGLIGAAFVGWYYLRKKQVDVHAYADVVLFGLPIGLAIGRIGCFLIHDHPGTATDFILGVQYPDEIVRHDLGLYQSISNALLFVLMIVLYKRKVSVGWFIIAFLGWYGVTRFFLDFLRATDGAIIDARYLGLTPAQYIAISMIIGGLYLVKRWKLKIVG